MRARKLDEALLALRGLAVAEVATRVGYENPAAFGFAFRRRFGRASAPWSGPRLGEPPRGCALDFKDLEDGLRWEDDRRHERGVAFDVAPRPERFTRWIPCCWIAAGALLIVAIVASLLPAVGAARHDPVCALKGP